MSGAEDLDNTVVEIPDAHLSVEEQKIIKYKKKRQEISEAYAKALASIETELEQYLNSKEVQAAHRLEQEAKDSGLTLKPDEQAVVSKVQLHKQEYIDKQRKTQKALNEQVHLIDSKLRDLGLAVSQAKRDKAEGNRTRLEKQITGIEKDIEKRVSQLEEQQHYAQDSTLSEYNQTVAARQVEKLKHRIHILEHRLKRRLDIKAGNKPPLHEELDTDLTDGGWSDLTDTDEYLPYHSRIKRNRNRQPKVKTASQIAYEQQQQELIRQKEEERKEKKRLKKEQQEEKARAVAQKAADQALLDEFEAELDKDLEEHERQQRRFRLGYTADDEGSEDEYRVVDFDSDDEYSSDDNMDRRGPRWSIRDLPHFAGRKDEENPTTHLMEFEDFMKEIGQPTGQPGFPFSQNQDESKVEIRNLVTKFRNSLKAKARRWFELNAAENIETADGWQELRDKFESSFSWTGGTREQMIKAWKDLKWDPASDSLDDFVYKFCELATALGYRDQKDRLESFLCCLPPGMYVFTMGSISIQDAVDKLKRGMGLGSIPMNAAVQPTIKPTSNLPIPGTVVPSGQPIPGFMSVRDKSVNFNPETVLKDSMKKVLEETISKDNTKLLQGLERMTETMHVALDRFEQNRDRDRDRDRDRSRDRDRNRGRDRQRRDSRDRSNSRSPNRRNNSRDRNDRGRSRSRDNSRDRSDNGYKSSRSGSGVRYNNKKKGPCTYCKKIGHVVTTCWTLENDLKAAGKVIVNTEEPKQQEDDDQEKAYMMQSLNSILGNMGLGVVPTNM